MKKETIMESEITCPICGYIEPESIYCMHDQMEFEHECTSCGAVLDICAEIVFSAVVKDS